MSWGLLVVVKLSSPFYQDFRPRNGGAIGSSMTRSRRSALPRRKLGIEFEQWLSERHFTFHGCEEPTWTDVLIRFKVHVKPIQAGMIDVCNSQCYSHAFYNTSARRKHHQNSPLLRNRTIGFWKRRRSACQREFGVRRRGLYQ